jgi:hypothetical protein
MDIYSKSCLIGFTRGTAKTKIVYVSPDTGIPNVQKDTSFGLWNLTRKGLLVFLKGKYVPYWVSQFRKKDFKPNNHFIEC